MDRVRSVQLQPKYPDRCPDAATGQQSDPHAPEPGAEPDQSGRSEEHTSELQSLMRISYAVFCLKKTKEERHTLDLPLITLSPPLDTTAPHTKQQQVKTTNSNT